MYEEPRKLVYRAGMLPYHVQPNGNIRMLFMKPADTEFAGDYYQLAKGRVEEGEEHRAAALREAKEEVGLFVGNTLLIEEVGVFMGRTTVYVAKIKDPTMFGEPDFETESTKWMSLEEFLVDGRPLHKPVVEACHRFITELENK